VFVCIETGEHAVVVHLYTILEMIDPPKCCNTCLRRVGKRVAHGGEHIVAASGERVLRGAGPAPAATN
jgi:hypothetical protein